jgi:hypothetical protein
MEEKSYWKGKLYKKMQFQGEYFKPNPSRDSILFI